MPLALSLTSRALVVGTMVVGLIATACTTAPPATETRQPTAHTQESASPRFTSTVSPGMATLIAKWATQEAAPTPAKPTATTPPTVPPPPAVTITVSPVACSLPDELRQEESPAVYGAALSHANKPQEYMLMSDSPAIDEWDLEWLTEEAQKDPQFLEPYLTGISAQTIAGFMAANSHPQIPVLADLQVPHEIIPSKQIDQLLGEDLASGWDRFEAKYPNSTGYWTVSQVGFNCKLDQALVFIRHVYGYAGMTGTFYLLSRQGDRWKVTDEFLFSEA